MRIFSYSFDWFFRTVVIAPVTLLSSGSIALAQSTHEHGLAELNVVREGQTVQIEFFSPAANLLGFERMPDSAHEWILFATVIEELEASDWLLDDQLADCRLSTQVLELPLFSVERHEHSHEHGGDDHGDESDHQNRELGNDAHVDFRVQYLFECPNSLPTQLQVTAFQHYPGIEHISARWIIERTPGFSVLTADAPVLGLE